MTLKKHGKNVDTTQDGKDKRVNKFTLHQYLKVMWHFKKYTITLLLSSITTTVCVTTLLPFTLARAIDLVSQRALLAWGTPLADTLLLALGFAAIAAISHYSGVGSFARLDIRAQSYLRERVFDRLVNESADFYANNMVGSLTSNVVAYVNGYFAVEELFLIRGINIFFPLIVGIIVVATQSLLLAGLFFVIVVVVACKALIDSRYRAPFRRARKAATSSMNGFIADVISNNAGVRAQAGEVQEARTLLSEQKVWADASFANLLHFGQHNAALLGSVNILQVVGIGVAAWLVMQGQISLGLVIFAVSYFQRMSSSLFDLAPAVQMYQGTMAESAPISEILMTQQRIVDTKTANSCVL